MLEGIDVFRIAGARMRHLAERQNVLAQNIANADTPRYRSRDVKAFSFDSALLRGAPGLPALTLAGTRAGHIGTTRNGVTITTDRANTYGEDPDGNTVDLEEQMVKQADLAKAYDMATMVYRRNTALMRTAIGGHA
jgi:flagellar basal-body rod protein FlgB